MTKSTRTSGRPDPQLHFAIGDSSLGSVLVAATPRGVCAILLGDDAEALVRELDRRFPRAELLEATRPFEQTVKRVMSLLERPSRPSALRLDIHGTAFQQRVWKALTKIAAGKTMSYAQIARKIGAPTSARAVAAACAANHLAVAIPCHRVVRSDGSLSGYRWGIERKRTLLAREAPRR
jgi:AraC family transcriptional regulator, regulatory protein of adaptative response / methylated-DNA-[protein]-cysteine methyltransferase